MINRTMFGMMIIRDDGRGLHDLFGKTHVVYANQPVISEIKEASVEEKEEPLKLDNKKITAKKRKKANKNENSNRK